jgi:hypothetical protein
LYFRAQTGIVAHMPSQTLSDAMSKRQAFSRNERVLAKSRSGGAINSVMRQAKAKFEAMHGRGSTRGRHSSSKG